MKQQYRRRFRLQVVVQVTLLVLSCALLAWSVIGQGMLAVPAVVAVIIAIQVWLMLRTVREHVDTLEEFFAAINYEDFTRRFVEGDIDSELRTAFNKVIESFQAARAERDLQAQYLETVVRHLPIAFIAARPDGSLRLVNHPARRLTGMSGLGHLDQLGASDPALPDAMRAIAPGTQKLLQTRLRDVPAELRVSVAEIRQGGSTERLYSLENLSGELTARESTAWRNLIRVLTHEIMNTLTPVTSLAQSCATMTDDPASAGELRDAVQTIARRSEGLTEFVSNYRALLKVPEPQPSILVVDRVLRDTVRLMKNELADVTVDISVVPESLTVNADPTLLDQVLLNVVRNALAAMESATAKTLRLHAALDYGRVCIRVRDSGGGVEADLVDQVFVPFFTTRRDGSGIGLSLCRQIMAAHGGEISLSNTGDGAQVVLRF